MFLRKLQLFFYVKNNQILYKYRHFSIDRIDVKHIADFM